MAVLGLTLAGCNVNARIDVVLHDDGSGVLRATITLDADAAARLGAATGLTPNVAVEDLRRVGWTISPWKQGAHGTQTISIAHAFSDQADLARRVGELAGSSGILRNPTLSHERSWFSSRDALSLVVDMRSPTLDITHDATLDAKLRSVGVDPATLQAQLTSELDDALHVTVVLHVPDAAPTTFVGERGRVETVRAAAGGTDWDHVVKFGIGVSLALIAGMFFLAAGVGARRNRRRAVQRVDSRPRSERAPLS